MELDNIKKLLNAYFEGTANIEEENMLMDYFTTQKVADELVPYQPIFSSFKSARQERSSKGVILPGNQPKLRKTSWYAAAAILIVALGMGGFFFSQPRYTPEEMEALAAFEKSKNAMMLLSENLNKGTGQLALMKQFSITKDKIFE